MFFRLGASSGAVFHLVVPARDFGLSHRMLKMPVVPCYPEYVWHTPDLACTSSWLFLCFALFFIVLDGGVDLVGVALSRFISVGPAVFCAHVSFCLLASVATWLCSLRVSAICGWRFGACFQCFALFFIVLDGGVDLVGVGNSRFISVCPAVSCAHGSFCLLASVATWLCSPRVSTLCGCWAVGVVTVSCHVFCTRGWSRVFCVFFALCDPLSCCGATGGGKGERRVGEGEVCTSCEFMANCRGLEDGSVVTWVFLYFSMG